MKQWLSLETTQWNSDYSESSPIQAEQLHDRFIQLCNSDCFHLSWGRHDGLPFIYSPKPLELTWKRSPRNPVITQELSCLCTEVLYYFWDDRTHKLVTNGSYSNWRQWQVKDLSWNISWLVSLSMSWKRWWSILSSSLQISLKWGTVNTLQVRAAIQWNPHRLEEWDLQQGQMQKPQPGEKQPSSRFLTGEEFCRKGPGGPGTQWAWLEPTVHPGSKIGQQHPGLYYQEHS